jgi:molybdopterin adenylyltransferase
MPPGKTRSDLEHKASAPASVGCYVLTVSDTRTEDTDSGGRAIVELLTAAGHRAVGRAIVKDDADQVRDTIGRQLANPDVQVIITTGGTGISSRDTTYEAVDGLLWKRLDGFGELFRMLSYQKIGTSTMQSRALGGVAGGTYLFALPGSTGAVKDAWDDILAAQLDNRHRPCNLVELMPRLQEHLRTAAE